MNWEKLVEPLVLERNRTVPVQRAAKNPVERWSPRVDRERAEHFAHREGNREQIWFEYETIGWGAHSLALNHVMHLCLVRNLCLVKPF